MTAAMKSKINKQAWALATQIKREWYQEGARGREWGPYQKYPDVELYANWDFIRQYLRREFKRGVTYMGRYDRIYTLKHRTRKEVN